MHAKDFRAIARQALGGRWTLAVITGLIASLLGGSLISTSSGSSVSSSVSNFLETDSGAALFSWMAGIVPDLLLAAFVVMLSLLSSLALVRFLIGGVVRLGYVKFNLALVDRQEADVRDLFSQLGRFADGFILSLLSTLYTFLWMLLLIVPGIIKSYGYAMAPYILQENPGMRPNAAIKASLALMRGNKWRLFCLRISFIGWEILAALTCGIGALWLHPYMESAQAAFYRQIVWERTEREGYEQREYRGPEL